MAMPKNIPKLGAVLMAAVVATCVGVWGPSAVAQPAHVPQTGQTQCFDVNGTALKATAAGGQIPIQVSRTLAMVQGAVHDALNAITRRYAAYYFEGPGEAGASPEAAAAAAAHTVLVGVIPSFGTPAQKVAALALVEDA
jgi:hypothetical protein